jgi:hypothetical protein
VPLAQLIRLVDPIEKPDRSIIQIEFCVMEIMIKSLVVKEIIPAMHGRGVEELISKK